jgi:hypothetical protein
VIHGTSKVVMKDYRRIPFNLLDTLTWTGSHEGILAILINSSSYFSVERTPIRS